MQEIEKAVNKLDSAAEKNGSNYAKLVASHLIGQIRTEDMAVKVLEEKKTLEGCMKEIQSKARKQTVFTASAGATGETQWRARGMWKDMGYRPKPGDLIHFTWGHVGIVSEATGSTVHTIEGNYSDMVAARSYDLSYSGIRGYAVPKYREDVRLAQNLLITNGFKLPRYGTDGESGAETVGQIKAYQQKV